MALVLTCDGCTTTLDPAAALTFGRYEPMYYCASCAQIYRAYLATETSQRIALVTAFEAWRTEARSKLRQSVARLPDE